MNEEKTLEERLQKLEELTAVQASNGNWNYSRYMMGLANGMLLALHIMKDEKGEVPYKSTPDEWLEDRYEQLKAQGWEPESVIAHE